MWVWLSALLLFPSPLAFAKSSCTARELRGQDCRLTQGTYRIRLLTETIARDDGTWHTVDPMPLKEPGVTWEKIQFDIQHGLPVLQLWIWDAGKGEAQVQALHWYVTDARKGTLKVLSEGIVRRRRLKPVEVVPVDPNAKPGAKPPETPKPSFLYDGWEKHSIKILKSGRVEWELGSAKKTLDPNAVKPEAAKKPEKTNEKGH